MNTYVCGHQNPDTDSVTSAIGYANLMGFNPAICGDLNKETKYVLDRFGMEAPKSLPDEEKQVFLVDHNEPAQYSPNIKAEEIIGILDHHPLSEATKIDPQKIFIQVVGSTSTLVALMYQAEKTEIPKNIAGLLLAGILSDTLRFSSPTTTEKDKKAAEELSRIAGVDVDELAEAMFAAKSDISDVSSEELVGKDFKVFDMSGKKVGIGVWETVKPETILSRKEEILQNLNEKKEKAGLSYIFFVGVDILGGNAKLFVASDGEREVAEAVWGGKTVENILELPGVVSRKKQIVPPLEKYFASK